MVDEVERLKAKNVPLNDEEFDAIGRRLGVGGKTKVKELRRQHKRYAEMAARMMSLGRDI